LTGKASVTSASTRRIMRRMPSTVRTTRTSRSTRAPITPPRRLALLYPGDAPTRRRADPQASRFAALFDAFAAAGLAAEPAVYHDDFAAEVEAQLRQVQTVLVWCNPIEGGRRRDVLDALLRRVAETGVHVSAHPDTILRLGTKDVIVETRDLPFGSDAWRVDSLQQLAAELPLRLRGGVRVLKQHWGHSGIGVWRVEPLAAGPLRVRHALRGSEEEVLSLAALLDRMAPYFDDGGHMVDQAWQPRLDEGMVRAYLVQGRVAGFGLQAVNALFPAQPGQAAPVPGPRLYRGADHPGCQRLRQKLEGGWIELLRQRVGLPHDRLPLLWDCDFMRGAKESIDDDRYVLCEVNVSSVSPFPESAIAPLVKAVQRLGA
jgi:hypothetical protein